MLMMPELAVALRRELHETVAQHADEVAALSIWSKMRPSRAEVYVAAMQRALSRVTDVVLWQKGAWAVATAARDLIGGELTSGQDMEPQGQIWLFDSVSLPSIVKKRFALPLDSRIVGRILFPLPASARDECTAPDIVPIDENRCGTAMGYLFRAAPAPSSRQREGLPFLRLLPDLYPGEFLVDPHINFIAARRYLPGRVHDVTPLALRSSGQGRILVVGDAKSL